MTDFALVFVLLIVAMVWLPVLFLEERERARRFDREMELNMAMWQAEWWWTHGRPMPHGGDWDLVDDLADEIKPAKRWWLP